MLKIDKQGLKLIIIDKEKHWTSNDKAPQRIIKFIILKRLNFHKTVGELREGRNVVVN